VKVNISYAVELEEVPAETDKLLGECEGILRRLHGDLEHAIGQPPLELITQIDSIRVSLEALDRRLDDCARIISGYVELKNKMTQGTNSEVDSD
jgi:hypothetical protein